MYKSLSKIAEGFSELGSDLIRPFRSSNNEFNLTDEQYTQLRESIAMEILEQIQAHPSPTVEKVEEFLRTFK